MEKFIPKITVMCDIDDVLWGMVEHWISDYKKVLQVNDDLDALQDYEAHDKHLSIDQVTSWDIINCLNPSKPNIFWQILDTKRFWDTIDTDNEVKQALKAVNDNKNIDLIICTDTYYKSATPKLTRFFELFPFIEPSQVICMKEKWRLNADIVIDDKPETLEKFMLKPNPPTFIIKINKPWNTTTICDYQFDKFDNLLATLCADAAKAYVDVINEIKMEQERNGNYERCYYN